MDHKKAEALWPSAGFDMKRGGKKKETSGRGWRRRTGVRAREHGQNTWHT